MSFSSTSQLSPPPPPPPYQTCLLAHICVYHWTVFSLYFYHVYFHHKHIIWCLGLYLRAQHHCAGCLAPALTEHRVPRSLPCCFGSCGLFVSPASCSLVRIYRNLSGHLLSVHLFVVSRFDFTKCVSTMLLVCPVGSHFVPASTSAESKSVSISKVSRWSHIVLCGHCVNLWDEINLKVKSQNLNPLSYPGAQRLCILKLSFLFCVSTRLLLFLCSYLL